MAASGDAATSGVNALSPADRDGGTDEVGRERGTHRDHHRVAHRDGLRPTVSRIRAVRSLIAVASANAS